MAIIFRLNPLRICPRSILSVAFAVMFCGIGLSSEPVGKMNIPQILSEFEAQLQYCFRKKDKFKDK